MPVNIDELLLRAGQGDEDVVEAILLHFHGQLSAEMERKIPGSLRSVLSVEDVLQAAYINVFQKIGTFRSKHGAGAFYRWLLTIAENKLIDMVKSERAAKRGGGFERIQSSGNWGESSVVDLLEVLAVFERSPSRSVAEREAASRIEVALGSLSKDYREVIRLRYLEGLSLAETADRMNRTEGAVSVLCHRSIRQLAEVIGSASRFFGSKE